MPYRRSQTFPYAPFVATRFFEAKYQSLLDGHNCKSVCFEIPRQLFAARRTFYSYNVWATPEIVFVLNLNCRISLRQRSGSSFIQMRKVPLYCIWNVVASRYHFKCMIRDFGEIRRFVC